MDEAKLDRAQKLLVVALDGCDVGEASAILCDLLIFMAAKAGISKDGFLARVSDHWDSRIVLITAGSEHNEPRRGGEKTH